MSDAIILCAIISLSSGFGMIFWICYLCRMTGNNSPQQDDLKVLNHQCEEGCGKCYSVDRNVIKISCPALVLKEVNAVFH
jgi:hypothetical protein